MQCTIRSLRWEGSSRFSSCNSVKWCLGGVGSGLYGMIVFAIVAVFMAGLMVGRTPEYLGKKIEPYEMKMASLLYLDHAHHRVELDCFGGPPRCRQMSVLNPGPHGFSEMLYAYTSMGNNNGSAFGGLNANTFFTIRRVVWQCCLSRFWIIIPTLALAGSLARKKLVPAGPGTLATHTPLFVVMLSASSSLSGR